MNINESVWVKLNDIGRQHHRSQHERLLGKFSGRFPYSPPVEDAEGWSRWQLWDLMHTFGPILSIGSQVPFEAEISFAKPAL
jgi:hypothetical protein